MTTLDDQIAELRRELGMRKKLYPGWIASGKLFRNQANKQYCAMEAALKTLERLQVKEVQTNLFQNHEQNTRSID
tara:strand:+ start:285 stop:509 length:225 start_codon:yes stop_codon:yes gene_type:complete